MSEVKIEKRLGLEPSYINDIVSCGYLDSEMYSPSSHPNNRSTAFVKCAVCSGFQPNCFYSRCVITRIVIFIASCRKRAMEKFLVYILVIGRKKKANGSSNMIRSGAGKEMKRETLIKPNVAILLSNF